VGNKSDLASRPELSATVERSRAAARDFVLRHGEGEGRVVSSVETSAKTGSNVEGAFLTLVDAMMSGMAAKTLAAQKKKQVPRRLSGSTPLQSEPSGWCAC
jgi:hypothetical protein